ncbi:MAG: hypothetical protein MJ234_04670 [bacterium]|nr:hypothetical protein [bacterium]
MEHGKTVPEKIKRDYNSFIKWCMANGIKDIGHCVAPLASTKLRCKPVNIEEFSRKVFENGSELDGSSFATGGGRVVHRAMVMAKPDFDGKWFVLPDPVRSSTLFVMSDMESPEGSAMCARHPLASSCRHLEKSIDNLMKTAGFSERHPNERYTLTVGYEKEFFIVPKEACVRDDIRYLGQTITGGPGPINQNLRGVYLSIPRRAEEQLLDDIVSDLAEVGIIATQKHLEVGQTGNDARGRQCEVVLKYDEAVNATDNDLIARQIIEDACDRHGFKAILGSKPFTDDSEGNGINGSGKHTNISIGKFDASSGDLTENFFETEAFCPSEAMEHVSLIGIAVLAAMGRAWPVLDASIASRGNEQRRKPGYEAPVYLSAFLGSTSEFRDSFASERNRSASIGLTGNKLEWRTPGANTNMYYPLAFLAIAVSDVIDEISENMKKAFEDGKTLQNAVDAEYGRLRSEIDHFVVSEDVFEISKDEAEDRFKCRVPMNTPDALTAFDSFENTSFLVKSGIFTEEMVKAFKIVQLENYIQRVIAEGMVMSRMSKELSNRTFSCGIMKTRFSDLEGMDIRLSQRRNFLGKLNADLMDLVDYSYARESGEVREKKDIATLIKEIKKEKDAEKAASVITEELIPLMCETRKIYEKMVDLMGGEEEVSKL